MGDLIPVTQLMSRYCDAATRLWNDSFRPLLWCEFDRPERENENDWDYRDRYEDICVSLFGALVLWPLGLHDLERLPSYRGDQRHLEDFVVRPLRGCEIRVTREDLHPFQGYDYSVTSTSQAEFDLRFQDFFDFDVMAPRAFEWVHAIVAGCVERPEFAGRAVLLKRADVGFYYAAP